MKYQITQTTDGQFEGMEVELTPSPLIIDEFKFYYDKKIVDGDIVILANSNYVINLIQ